MTAILMVTANLGYGGSESDFLRLARWFRSQGHNVSLAVMSDGYGGDYTDDYSAEGFELHYLAEPNSGGVVAKALRWLKMRRNLRALKRRHDSCISFLSGPNLLNALAGQRSKTIVSERGSKRHHVNISARDKILWLKFIDPMVYRLSRAVVAVSWEYAQEVRDIAIGNDKAKVLAIEGLIDSDSLFFDNVDLPDTPIHQFIDDDTIIATSRLDKGKGFEQLLDIFALVLKNRSGAKLLIVGDGPIKTSLEDQCQSLGLVYGNSPEEEGISVLFVGYQEAPIRYIRQCKVLCFATQHEGLSNTLLEAVAASVHIVASDCPWGNRTILGGKAQETVTYPAKLAFGTLLPVPNTVEQQQLWADVIVSRLDEPLAYDTEAAKAYLKRYDVAETGPKWLSLAEEAKSCTS